MEPNDEEDVRARGDGRRADVDEAIGRIERDRRTAIEAKKFIKPIPYHELKKEIDLFCELFAQPAVAIGLRKFVESTDVQPYLP